MGALFAVTTCNHQYMSQFPLQYNIGMLYKEVNLLNFLTLTEDDLKNVGVKMPYERYQILSGLYRLHKHPFKTKALPIIGKSETYSTLNVANSLLSATRQFIVMQGSLRYIQMNLQNPNELKQFSKEIQKMKESLTKIRLVVDKICVKAAEWDYETAPADLITKQSCNKLKSSKFKYCFTVGVASISAYAICKKINFFRILS
ncbi:hypothetical protein QE152_g37882 [Popillia japonica]|uniref:SAM domain-containing protein n=1 Tax=Popillia japonica TaxID=7064 RepID=A0AAW1I954_POPJA